MLPFTLRLSAITLEAVIPLLALIIDAVIGVLIGEWISKLSSALNSILPSACISKFSGVSLSDWM